MSVAKGKALFDENFFDAIGGHQCLNKVHNILYTKLFNHPWLKGFFVNSTRKIVESQQNDFWAGLMGGPAIYGGRSPMDAHVHMFLPAEAFEIRHQLLEDALVEAGVPAHLRERWLIMDSNFKRAIVNQSSDECHGRYRTEEVLIVPKPGAV